MQIDVTVSFTTIVIYIRIVRFIAHLGQRWFLVIGSANRELSTKYIQKWNYLEYHVANGFKMSAYLSTTTGHSSLELHVRMCCHPAINVHTSKKPDTLGFRAHKVKGALTP